MPTIEIDEEVFAHLERSARPFIESTPNAVLRRLLLQKGNGRAKRTTTTRPPSSSPEQSTTDEFVQLVLAQDFGTDYRRRRPYRYMFESGDHVVYFQNFNKADSDNLWYRIRRAALDVLRAHGNTATLCFTNPADKTAYCIPVTDLARRLTKVAWSRNDLEVNIDYLNNRWRELDWDIGRYLKRYHEA